MIKRAFRWTDGSDTDSGMEGWLPAWFDCDNYDAGCGLSVAHDTLEHRRSDTGQWHEELMAFGAIINIRSLNGWYRRAGYPRTDERAAEEMGQELVSLYEQYCYDQPLMPAPHRPLRPSKDEAHVHLWVDRVIASAQKTRINSDDDWTVLSEADIEGWRQYPYHGFMLARQRYAGYEHLQLDTFTDLQEKVNEVSRRAYDRLKSVQG